MANALVRLWELDQYDDAELLRKKFAAMMIGVHHASESVAPEETMG